MFSWYDLIMNTNTPSATSYFSVVKRNGGADSHHFFPFHPDNEEEQLINACRLANRLDGVVAVWGKCSDKNIYVIGITQKD